MTEMAKKDQKIAELEGTVRSLTEEVETLQRKLDRMNELLLNAQRARFGQSSEKTKYVSPDQLQFFDEPEQEQNSKAPEPTEETFTVKAHERKKKRTVEELAAGLPQKDILLSVPEEGRICGCCGKPMKAIGKRFLKHEVEVIPKQVNLLAYYAETYACPDCEKKTGYANILTLNPPPPLMKHSLASPSAVADVMTQKFVDGIPLYRQEKIWAREGVELNRATLANWIIRCAEDWLKPMYKELRLNLLKQAVIHADETPVQVLKEDGKPATSESRMWVYASSTHAEQQVRYFEYQPDRSGKRPGALLKDYSGCLVTDGYAGYNQVLNAVHCGCWAHMHRKWREAMPDGATTANSKAAIGFQYCVKLFGEEKKLAGLAPEARKQARQAKVAPLLDAYWSWVEKLDPTPGSKLEDAVVYARNQKAHLNAFMEHGEVDVSNNTAENAIRPFVVGRKNWLFYDTPKGAESGAIVYTLVESAKANELEPRKYLETLLEDLRWVGRSPDHDRLSKLLPWAPGIRKSCAAAKKE